MRPLANPTAYGIGFRDHFLALKALWTPTPDQYLDSRRPDGDCLEDLHPNPHHYPTFYPHPERRLKAQIINNGLDSTSETDFGVKITNTGSSAVTGVSFRLYSMLILAWLVRPISLTAITSI